LLSPLPRTTRPTNPIHTSLCTTPPPLPTTRTLYDHSYQRLHLAPPPHGFFYTTRHHPHQRDFCPVAPATAARSPPPPTRFNVQADGHAVTMPPHPLSKFPREDVRENTTRPVGLTRVFPELIGLGSSSFSSQRRDIRQRSRVRDLRNCSAPGSSRSTPLKREKEVSPVRFS